MKIVVLDGYTLNPGDLSWDRFKRLGDVTVYDRTSVDKIIGRSEWAEILLTNKTPLSADTISKLPKLRYIGVLATGYNVVDIKEALCHGITVTNVPIYGTNSVAQMTFALLLELCNHVQNHSNAVRQGEWSQSPDFCFWKYPLIELAEKTMGIIGFGRIGRQVAQIASAIGMRILAADRTKTNPPNLNDFKWAETSELLSESDVVSLHCPLFPDTERLINRKTIDLMKGSALLINTSRGGLVVDKDLAEALNNRRLAGAGIDLLSMEPPNSDNPLLIAKNCLITPHIAWATREARKRLMDTAIKNLEAFLNGHPVNDVSK